MLNKEENPDTKSTEEDTNTAKVTKQPSGKWHGMVSAASIHFNLLQFFEEVQNWLLTCERPVSGRAEIKKAVHFHDKLQLRNTWLPE